MYINKEQNAAYGFIAPNIAAHADQKIEVPFPTFEALSPVIAENACAINVNCRESLVDVGTLAANATITVNKTENTVDGDKVTVKVKTAATETLTFAGDVTCPTITGAAGKTKVQSLIFFGEKFIPVAAVVQID
jgi:hypothetical protein